MFEIKSHINKKQGVKLIYIIKS